MPDNNVVLRIFQSEKCKKWLFIAAIVLGFLSIAECIILVSLSYILFRDGENSSSQVEDQEMAKVMRMVAILSLILGIVLIVLSLGCKPPKRSVASQVVVSPVPAEDLEKSPAPTLGSNYAPRIPREAFVENAANNVTVVELRAPVNDIHEINNSSVNAGFWSVEEIEGGITPPPSYDEAIVMPQCEDCI